MSYPEQYPARTNIFKEVGRGISLKVCPNASQLFLAFTTLLFFASFECILLTIIVVRPALEARSFSLTKCTVVKSFKQGNTSCLVSSVANDVAVNVFPCLQIYVLPNVSGSTTAFSARRTKRDTWFGIAELSSNSEKYSSEDETSSAKRSKRSNQNITNKNAANSTPYLLFQNELNFAGNDYLYRRCSYLPARCPTDLQQTTQEIQNYALKWGVVNQTYDCYFSAESDQWSNGRVMRYKLISIGAMWNSIVWPLIGMFTSVLCCVGFWRRSYRHMSRLFIYNSWSAS